MESTPKLPTQESTHSLHGAIRRISKNKRSNRVIMTDEARVLKEVREERKAKLGERVFSLNAVAKKMGRTDSWLAQIENGRADVPQDERLDSLLLIYGLKRKSFFERVRLYKAKRTPQMELMELAPRLTDETAQMILKFANTMIG